MANKDRIPTHSIRISRFRRSRSRFRRSRSRSRHLSLPNPTQTQERSHLYHQPSPLQTGKSNKIAPWRILGGGRGVELGGFDEGEGFGEGTGRRRRRRSGRRSRRVGRDGYEGLGGLRRIRRRRRWLWPLLRRTSSVVGAGHDWGRRRGRVKWGI